MFKPIVDYFKRVGGYIKRSILDMQEYFTLNRQELFYKNRFNHDKEQWDKVNKVLSHEMKQAQKAKWENRKPSECKSYPYKGRDYEFDTNPDK